MTPDNIRPGIHDHIPNEVKLSTNESRERLSPGFGILMAGPSTVAGLGFTRPFGTSGIHFDPNGPYDHATALKGLQEHAAIRDLLVSMVGSDRVKVINTKIMGTKATKDGLAPVELGSLKPGYPTFETPYLNRYYQTWLRDAHTLLDDVMLVNPNAWTTSAPFMRPSPLGEMGRVLLSGRTLMVGIDLWRDSKVDIRSLQERGYNIAPLPVVDPTKQANEFHPGHIDGHAALIKDMGGDLVLLTANSYAFQGSGTRKQIRSGAMLVGAEVVEIDDIDLPSLSLNLIQFEDGSIACTATRSGLLESTLADIVGPDKVFSTSIPLELIPEKMTGSIRCMTNVVPL